MIFHLKKQKFYYTLYIIKFKKMKENIEEEEIDDNIKENEKEEKEEKNEKEEKEEKNEKEEKEEKKEKEEKNEKEEKDASEKDLLLIKKDSKDDENYDYRDILLLNDLDYFYKTGKIPFAFFSHLLCTFLVTLIILIHNDNLNKLMQQSRAVQASFYLHEDTENPDYDFPKEYYYSKYETFSENLVKIINNIYNINKTINFDIIYDNQDNIKMFTKFRISSDISNKSLSGYNGTFPYVFNITKGVDPIKTYFENNTKENEKEEKEEKMEKEEKEEKKKKKKKMKKMPQKKIYY